MEAKYGSSFVPILNGKTDSAQMCKRVRSELHYRHTASMLTQEAALAVAQVAPKSFWKFSLAIFYAQEDFYDVPLSTLTSNQIREKLVELGISSASLSSEEAEKVQGLLKLREFKNSGSSVLDVLKSCGQWNIPPARLNVC